MIAHRTLAYMAQPYSHASEIIKAQRAKLGAIAAAYFLSHRCPVFAPIPKVESIHPHARSMKHEDWLDYDRVLYDRCDFLLLLPLEGWRESIGVTQELAWAREDYKPIFQIVGTIPGIPPEAMHPASDLLSLVCDQYGPRQFPEFYPERNPKWHSA